jgi:hypothetical protein
MAEDLKFPARISKMGSNKIIWIPKIMHDMIEKFEDETVTVTITRRNTPTTIVKGDMKDRN